MIQINESWKVHLNDFPQAISLNPVSGLLAVALLEGPIAILDAGSGEWRRKLRGHEAGTGDLAWMTDSNLLASGGQDGRVRIWSPDKSDPVCESEVGKSWVERVTVSPKGDHLAASCGSSVCILRPDGSVMTFLGPFSSTVTALEWLPCGQRLLAGGLGELRLIDLENTSSPACVFELSVSPVCAAISPAGQWVACGCSDRTLRLFSLTDHPCGPLGVGPFARKVRQLHWNADSSCLGTAGGDMVVVVSMEHLIQEAESPDEEPAIKPIRTMQPVIGIVSALTFHPACPFIAVGSKAGQLVFDEYRLNKRVSCIQTGEGEIVHLLWTSLSANLLVASEDGAVSGWNVLLPGCA